MNNLDKLADLLKALTYEEMMELAEWMSCVSRQYAENEGAGELTPGYMATTLLSWADGQIDDACSEAAD